MTMNGDTAVALAQQLAADFANRADKADREARLPPADVAALRESGYLRLSVPREFGDQVALAQGSPSTALVAGMQLHIFGHAREARTWRDDVYAHLSREAASGGLFNSLASEPKLGSPSRGGLPATTAVQVDKGWCVNGRKTWSTGGKHLTHLLVRVALDRGAGPEEPAVVLVKQDAAGLRWAETWRYALSLRASDSHDAIFENVLVPTENLVETGDAKACPNVWFPLMMASVYLGAALAARHAVIRYALERAPTALGQPIATLPKIQRQIGEMDVGLQAAEALLLAVAGEWTGQDADRTGVMARVAAAKMMVTETAVRVTDQALQVAGGSAISGELPLGRYLRDVRAGAMQPPSGDTAFEMIGRAAIEGQQRA